MLSNGQTMRHKETNKLARLDPVPGETWAWDIGKKTAFVAKDGTKFIDDIGNYTHVEDELGRPYSRMPAEGQFVDESAEKYLISAKKLAEMRQKKLKEWEAEVLDRMENGGPKPYTEIIAGVKTTIYPRHCCDVAGKSVHCPFADGSDSLLFRKFFLANRGATSLYEKWGSVLKKYVSGPMVFRHTDGQIWIYNEQLSELVVIKDIKNIV